MVPFLLILWRRSPPLGFRLIALFTWTMLFNHALKISFQVPLFPHIPHPGFAFPSGHMQISSLFYGFILIYTPSLYGRAALLLLISAIGGSLVLCGYHSPGDVIAALAIATMTLAIHILPRGYEVLMKASFLFVIYILIHSPLSLSYPLIASCLLLTALCLQQLFPRYRLTQAVRQSRENWVCAPRRGQGTSAPLHPPGCPLSLAPWEKERGKGPIQEKEKSADRDFPTAQAQHKRNK
ncbi:MAG: phosphatase PAP2 family protein [Chlamydiota bacterium]|nr:phosphatase PAP2 family protein [Chlamydiota bacterium]